MILSAATLRRLRPVEPFREREVVNGMSRGLSGHGYDIAIDQEVLLWPGRFVLVSSRERFRMPNDVAGIVHDKSTWARRGVAVQNTVIEAGWEGYLTLELTLHGWRPIRIRAGDPIAQVIFHYLDGPAEPYRGKYQNQPPRPVPALREP